MLPATDEERDDVVRYYLSQSPRAEVNFLQKVYSEAVIGHRHDVWDVHASDGRWWVITNPTNLYSQDQFPNMDLAVTFHMGLFLRIPRTDRPKLSRRKLAPFGALFAQLQDISDAVGQAHGVGDYQAVGVRCREALLGFIAAAQNALEWDAVDLPKRADFNAWTELTWNRVLTGASQAHRRRLLKTLLKRHRSSRTGSLRRNPRLGTMQRQRAQPSGTRSA